MRQILRITKTELQVLFYSPIAWFILIVFIVQSSLSYFDMVKLFGSAMEDGRNVADVTYGLFVQYFGRATFFPSVLNNLFYYIPLLTMGVMSRELSSGSIKLLYSSPINNTQIVIGKFLAVATYGLMMVAVVFLFVIHGASITPEHFDWGFIPVSLLGIFLLICAYCAVGIFMSSMTSYQMVAMLSTLVVLTFFSYIGSFWQEIPFVRDITYWLSMNGRAGLFVRGVLCSEDFIYFITVIFLFLSLTVLRLRVKRDKMSTTHILGRYAFVFGIVIAVAFISSRPAMKKYLDATRFERLTLTKASQDIIAQMDDKYTITTYLNLYDHSNIVYKMNPKTELNDINNVMGPYTRFKPEIELKYVYYISKSGANYAYLRKNFPNETDEEILQKNLKRYDVSARRIMSEEEVAEIEPMLAEENFRSIKVIENSNGKKEIIRYFNDMIAIPMEPEVSAALKRMITDDYPRVAFVEGHNERSIHDSGDLSYSGFSNKYIRSSLYNNGFDVETTTFENPIPNDVNILVVADPRSEYTETEMANFKKYVDRGGNMIILGEQFRKDYINPLMAEFGYKMADGCLVKPYKGNRADYIAQKPTVEGANLSYFFDRILKHSRNRVSTPSASYLEQIEDKGYKATVLLGADPVDNIIWNELETRYFEEFEPVFNTEAGEKRMANAPISYALERKVGDKTQKIVLSADADCFANQERGPYPHRGIAADNPSYVTGIFEWMSDGASPIDMRRPSSIDNNVNVSPESAQLLKYIYMWGISLIILVAAVIINIRRRSK